MLPAAEPFLRWAGGKRRLLPALLPLLPEQRASETTYFEPFLGGGALFFAYQPAKAVLSDLNSELIMSYEAVRDDVERVISSLAALKHGREEYYRIRSWRPRKPHTRAARLIYLSKTCFNGLYRVNARGHFNVPMGRQPYKTLICDKDQLRSASISLQSADLRASDFEDATEGATSGDVVYFDPPYIVGHTDNGFVEYNARVFAWDDQLRLAECARRLARKGVNVMVSNANHPSIATLYDQSEQFRCVAIDRQSTIAAHATKRFRASELVMVSTPSEEQAWDG